MKWLAGLAVTGLLAVPALADPEVPAVSRDVAMVVDEQFTHPIIPPMRTSPAVPSNLRVGTSNPSRRAMFPLIRRGVASRARPSPERGARYLAGRFSRR
ncbi:MAG: hypothetical protein VCB78_04600 [Myxococcota bacterium]